MALSSTLVSRNKCDFVLHGNIVDARQDDNSRASSHVCIENIVTLLLEKPSILARWASTSLFLLSGFSLFTYF